jgi:rubrerythrin
MSDASDLFLLELAGVLQQLQRKTPATTCSRVIRLIREHEDGVKDLLHDPGEPCPHYRWTRKRLGYAPQTGQDEWRCNACGDICIGNDPTNA